jgi:hypothetical protein
LVPSFSAANNILIKGLANESVTNTFPFENLCGKRYNWRLVRLLSSYLPGIFTKSSYPPSKTGGVSSETALLVSSVVSVLSSPSIISGGWLSKSEVFDWNGPFINSSTEVPLWVNASRFSVEDLGSSKLAFSDILI